MIVHSLLVGWYLRVLRVDRRRLLMASLFARIRHVALYVKTAYVGYLGNCVVQEVEQKGEDFWQSI